ncbi:MAG: hypothetical protein LAN71_12215 [Acidobacteriia bacterium]|nr:hypothetical protein [Terriglobia bacterium]
MAINSHSVKTHDGVCGLNDDTRQYLPAECHRPTVSRSPGGSHPPRSFGRLNWLLSKIKISSLTGTSTAACLAVASLVALGGCTSMKVKLGMRVQLDKIPVASLHASLSKGPAIAPGENSPLVVQFTQPDGKVLTTEGQGKGKVLWKDITVTPTIVNVNQKGIVTLPRDPRISLGKLAHLTITVSSHPDLRAELDIPITYAYDFVSNFSGSNGSEGMSGSDGLDGTSGGMGSIDPTNPSPGGDGSNGADGSDGQDGGKGGDAPPVQVRVALRSGSHPLLQVLVTAAGQERRYLVDPQGGSITIKTDGGPGGSGGRGGRGGRGGSGGMGIPNGNTGRDGSSGRNGFDGSPGKGGSITVTYDPQSKSFLTVIHLSNPGGPPPVFKEEPVTLVW